MEDKFNKQMKYELATGEEMTLTPNLVKNYLVTGNNQLVSLTELLFFMHECKARKLNPFRRQCWLIKYSANESAQIVESIHHKRNKAMEHPLCQGWQKGIIIKDTNGNIKKTNGFLQEGEILLGAWFKAKPKNWSDDFILEINLDAYIKKKRTGEPTAFWSKQNQASQIMKVVESQGLSTLFGNAGITYIEEELPEIQQNEIQIPQAAQPVEVINDVSEFDNLVAKHIETLDGFKRENFEQYLTDMMEGFCLNLQQVKSEAIQKFDSFVAGYKEWIDINKKE